MQAEGQALGTEQDLNSYFQSIQPSYEATLRAEDLRSESYDGFGASFVFFLFLLFSLVPAIPALLYFSARLISKPIVLNLFGSHVLPVHSFRFWYAACLLFFAVLFGLRLAFSSLQERRSRVSINTDELLNDAQMRFAHCYSVIAHIDLYRTNKRSIHLDNARESWRKFLFSLRSVFGQGFDWIDDELQSSFSPPHIVVNGEIVGSARRRNLRFFPQVHKLLNTFSWFQLAPDTASIIEAFDGLKSKIDNRIADKKDLFQVSECLLPLSLYFYTQIPDISDTEEEKAKFSEIEKAALNSFAQQMSQITRYRSEERIPPKEQKAAIKRAKLEDFLLSTVGSKISFVRFISVWLLVQVFLATAIPLILVAIKSIKLDSTLIALLVGSPLAVAAALTAIPSRTQDNSSDEKK